MDHQTADEQRTASLKTTGVLLLITMVAAFAVADGGLLATFMALVNNDIAKAMRITSTCGLAAIMLATAAILTPRLTRRKRDTDDGLNTAANSQAEQSELVDEPDEPEAFYYPRTMADIPIGDLPCGRDALEWGYELRICDRCSPAFFGLGGPGGEQSIGVRGAGDMCASCGWAPRDAKGTAEQDLAGILVKALVAGAQPTELQELFSKTMLEVSAELEYKLPDFVDQPRTWPATW